MNKKLRKVYGINDKKGSFFDVIKNYSFQTHVKWLFQESGDGIQFYENRGLVSADIKKVYFSKIILL